MARPLAILLALAYLAGNAFVLLLLVFFATFPFDNQRPEDRGKDDWLIGVGLVLVAFALLTLIAVLLRRTWSALMAFVINAGVGFVLLGWALRQSEHSDGKLLLYGFAIELTGIAAVGLTTWSGDAASD